MRRYRFLRAMGCDWLTSGFIALLNASVQMPENEIRFLTLTIVMADHQQNAAQGGGEK